MSTVIEAGHQTGSAEGKNMKKILLGAAAVAAAAVFAGCASKPAALPTQSGVDLQKYAGVWYEQARLPNRFQNDCAGDVRAEYALNDDGTLLVVNQCRQSDGTTKRAEAVGRLAESGAHADPAKLEVRFAPAWTSWLPIVWGDYWIIRLEDDYAYSLVGTPDRKYLWVLSREEQADTQRVQALLDYAGTLGFPVTDVIHADAASRN